jgi:hypothetical protein
MSGNKQEPLGKKNKPSSFISDVPSTLWCFMGKITRPVHENHFFPCSNALSCRQHYSVPNGVEIAQ